jgi:DNA-binding YbaB/EbfC family protein
MMQQFGAVVRHDTIEPVEALVPQASRRRGCGDPSTFEVIPMMKGGMAGLMKQAQQMQEKMAKMQEELANAEVTGKAGGDMVTVVMTGRHDVKRVSIDPSLVEGLSEDDKEMLEACSPRPSTTPCARSKPTGKMSGMTAGMQLPPGMKLPFGQRLD